MGVYVGAIYTPTKRAAGDWTGVITVNYYHLYKVFLIELSSFWTYLGLAVADIVTFSVLYTKMFFFLWNETS